MKSSSSGDTHSVDSLVQALRILPGVGIKSAARMAYHLLQRDRAGALRLSQALQVAVNEVRHCESCNTFTEQTICVTCLDPQRDRSRLCIVETPSDQAVMERTGAYNGLYYVLLGRLNPIDGVGIEELNLKRLFERAIDKHIQEVIIATSFTAEGEATAHVLSQSLKKYGVTVTRLARGVPVGGELEYIDLSTVAHALADRR